MEDHLNTLLAANLLGKLEHVSKLIFRIINFRQKKWNLLKIINIKLVKVYFMGMGSLNKLKIQ